MATITKGKGTDLAAVSETTAKFAAALSGSDVNADLAALVDAIDTIGKLDKATLDGLTAGVQQVIGSAYVAQSRYVWLASKSGVTQAKIAEAIGASEAYVSKLSLTGEILARGLWSDFTKAGIVQLRALPKASGSAPLVRAALESDRPAEDKAKAIASLGAKARTVENSGGMKRIDASGKVVASPKAAKAAEASGKASETPAETPEAKRAPQTPEFTVTHGGQTLSPSAWRGLFLSAAHVMSQDDVAHVLWGADEASEARWAQVRDAYGKLSDAHASSVKLATEAKAKAEAGKAKPKPGAKPEA